MEAFITRDILLHEYNQIAPQSLWNTITRNLPDMRHAAK
ncbi:MAG: DUF86 domain-containing protein [Deltaproteobacteria bacterium]|nr:DUF86 domain-containing protein [Deltaproteobacteria bacterium]